MQLKQPFISNNGHLGHNTWTIKISYDSIKLKISASHGNAYIIHWIRNSQFLDPLYLLLPNQQEIDFDSLFRDESVNLI